MAEKIKKAKIDNVGIHSFSKKADIFFSIISGLIALSCTLHSRGRHRTSLGR